MVHLTLLINILVVWKITVWLLCGRPQCGYLCNERVVTVGKYGVGALVLIYQVLIYLLNSASTMDKSSASLFRNLLPGNSYSYSVQYVYQVK